MNTVLPPVSARVVAGDIPDALLRAAIGRGVAAVDIETTGLDWEACRICTCQVAVPGEAVAVVSAIHAKPARLLRLLGNGAVRKVFHHAMFDLRFMGWHWGAEPRNIACTKIASKLLDPQRKSHSLKPLLHEHLGVEINKDQQLSDWTHAELSTDQITYAVADVAYLLPLLDRQTELLEGVGRLKLYRQCLSHVPTRVQLDLLKCPDVFAY